MALLSSLLLASLLAAPTPHPGTGASASTPLRLLAPPARSVLPSGETQVPVIVAPEQAWASGLRVEVDGTLHAFILPWSTETTLTLEPGLHRIQVRGLDRRNGSTLHSSPVQVAVFPEAQTPTSPREYNAWTALFAFGIAIGGATTLRKRGAL